MFGKLQSQSGQFQAMRSHLCQILAHYVLFLGSQLKLPIPTDAEQSILETAPSQWNKEGLFQWKNRLEDKAGFYAEDSLDTSTDVIDSSTDYMCAVRQACRTFHFATHGWSDQVEPSQSCLLLEDWETNPLTCGDLRDHRSQNPFLAYLSACSTRANEADRLADTKVLLWYRVDEGIVVWD